MQATQLPQPTPPSERRRIGDAWHQRVRGLHMLKLKGSELVQSIDELTFSSVGYWAAPLDSIHLGGNELPVGPDYAEYTASGRYHHRGFTIAGGSSEIQHDIIAKQVLGL